MIQATLTLEGIAPLHGTVDTGGDYIRFTTYNHVDSDQLARLTEGEIAIDGKSEKVMVKSVQPHHKFSRNQGDMKGIEVTLQRFAPSPH